MLNFLDTANFKTMQKSLDILTKRIEVTGQNISNVNTPFYKAKKLEYENLFTEKLVMLNNSYALQMRLKKGGSEEYEKKIENWISSVKPKIYTDEETETRVDGNNVDMDHENLELARFQLQYNYMIRKITDEYNLLKHAIAEGR